ncbi:hypothetical protein EON63_23000 [archaeon]|nr:MAG: hypothetical protein EON63_23000 [archaeon]
MVLLSERHCACVDIVLWVCVWNAYKVYCVHLHIISMYIVYTSHAHTLTYTDTHTHTILQGSDSDSDADSLFADEDDDESSSSEEEGDGRRQLVGRYGALCMCCGVRI